MPTAFPLPNTIRDRILQKTESFLVKHREVKLPVLSMPLNEGGIDALDFTVFCKALYVTTHIRYAVENDLEVGAAQLRPFLREMELGAGGLNISPAPNIFNRDVARVSGELGLGPGCDLCVGDIHRQHMGRLRAGLLLPMFPCDVSKLWQNCHSDILELKYREFNYRLVYNTLPLRSKPRIRAIAPSTACVLCGDGMETVHHLFVGCDIVRPVWQVIDSVMSLIMGGTFPPLTSKEIVLLDPTIYSPNKTQNLAFSYLITMTKHTIWMHRNKVVFNSHQFDPVDTLKHLKYRTFLRMQIEARRTIPKAMGALSLVGNALNERIT